MLKYIDTIYIIGPDCFFSLLLVLSSTIVDTATNIATDVSSYFCKS